MAASERRRKDVQASRRRAYRTKSRFGLSAEQWPFVLVLLSNWAFGAAVYVVSSALVTWTPEVWDTIADKLLVVVRNAVFASVPIIAAILIVSAQRLNPGMMVGHVARPNSALDVNTRFILNTAEQFVLYFIGQLGLMLFAPQENVKTLVILTGIWLLGRILFWVGYHKNPYLRAFGFGLTFYPTILVFIWLIVKFTTDYRLF